MFVMPDISRYFRNKETYDLGRGDRTVDRSRYVLYLTTQNRGLNNLL
jgi:hypothetical protein